MSTTQPEHHAGEQEQSRATPVRYVEELAGPEDTWISITDAARITRSSEAMARRWVTSGRLPVRRQPVGLNQQTRMVRLSDVAAIRPIIDPAAAITDEVRKLDLPSIPRQQAQIMRDHESLLQQLQQGQKAIHVLQTSLGEVAADLHRKVEEFHDQLLGQQASIQELRSLQQEQRESFLAQVQGHTQILDQLTQEMGAHSEQFQHRLDVLRLEVTAGHGELQHEVERKIAAADQEHRRQKDEIRQDLLARFQHQQERIDDALQTLNETLARQEQRHTRFQQDLVAQQGNLTTLIEQRVCEVQASFQQSLSQQTQNWVALRERLEKLEQKVEQGAVRAEAEQVMLLEYQQRFEAHNQRLQMLTSQLHNESEERTQGAALVHDQQKQIQTLLREVQELKHLHLPDER